MRICILLLVSILSCFKCLAQDSTKQERFIVLYTTGENWDTTKQFYEQAYFKEHSAHLSALRKAKRIQLGGRYSNTGMILITAKDETEANELITKDEAIKHKLFNTKIYPFDAFYKGCID